MQEGRTQIGSAEQATLSHTLNFINVHFQDFSHQQKIFLVTACLALAFPERKSELSGDPGDYFKFASERIKQSISQLDQQAITVESRALKSYLVNFQEVFNERGQYLAKEAILAELQEVGLLQKKGDEYLILGESPYGVIHYGDCDFMLKDGQLEIDFNGLRLSKVLKRGFDQEKEMQIVQFAHGLYGVIDQQLVMQVGESFPDGFMHLHFNHQNQLLGIMVDQGEHLLFQGDEIIYQLDSKPIACFFSPAFQLPTGYVITQKTVNYFILGELHSQVLIEDYNVQDINFSAYLNPDRTAVVCFWGTMEKNTRTIPFVSVPIEEIPGFGKILDTEQFYYFGQAVFGKFRTEKGIVFGFNNKYFQSMRGEQVTEFIPDENFTKNGLGVVKTGQSSFPMIGGKILTQNAGDRIEQYVPIESAVPYTDLTGWLITNKGARLFVDGSELCLNEGARFHCDPANPPKLFIDHLKMLYFHGAIINSEGAEEIITMMAGEFLQSFGDVQGFRDLYVNASGDFRCILDSADYSYALNGKRNENGDYDYTYEEFDARDLSLVGFDYFGQMSSLRPVKTFLGKELLGKIDGIRIVKKAVVQENMHLAIFESERCRGLTIGGKILYEDDCFRNFQLKQKQDGGCLRVDYSFERNQITHSYGFTIM